MAELAREEVEELSAEAQKLEEKLKLLLLPKDPLDERNIMLEVELLFPALVACIILIVFFSFLHKLNLLFQICS